MSAKAKTEGGGLSVVSSNVDFSSEANIMAASSEFSMVDALGESQPSDRSEWGGKVEYLLTCISYAVGLGNVWRFPYLVYANGGGAFLIPYILTLFLVGMPLFFMELSWGQFASSGPLTVWTINPLFKGVGMASVIVVTYITLYFNVILSWCFYYLFASMQAELPWTGCNNTWNSEFCRTIKSLNKSEPDEIKNQYKSPTEEYFYNEVLRLSDSIDDFGSIRPELAGFLLLSWAIVFLVLIKGINSLGKVSYVVATLPYLVLTILLVNAAMLEGSIDGVLYYIRPQWDKLADFKVWNAAATQIFYSTGVCLGCLITMGSYNKFKNNTLKDALIVPPINCLTSIYSGFVIFAVLGYMARIKDVEISKVAADGPGLVFVVYPEALATMPLPQLWSVLFFIMLGLIGFGSIFTQAEAAVTAILDQFPATLRVGRRPVLVRLTFCVIGFLITLPMVCEGGFFLFQIVNDYSAGYQVLVIGLLELFVLIGVYGVGRFSEDVEMMIGKPPPLYFKFCLTVAAPGLCAVILVAMMVLEDGLLDHDGVPFPGWTMVLVWLLVLFPIGVIFFYMVGRFLLDGGWQAMKKASAPRRHWGPANPLNRTGRYSTREPEVDGQGTGSVDISDSSPTAAAPPAYHNATTSDRF